RILNKPAILSFAACKKGNARIEKFSEKCRSGCVKRQQGLEKNRKVSSERRKNKKLEDGIWAKWYTLTIKNNDAAADGEENMTSNFQRRKNL
ncbi:MAG TPA: hypothetical protein IAA32_06160, partial [Candidatus Butyricicoccus stercorigallinarum]|nr:hypothetical protein [Candidatus Butyricicoccus stercorigallinarum]